jgi:predicted aspartyl protease
VKPRNGARSRGLISTIAISLAILLGAVSHAETAPTFAAQRLAADGEPLRLSDAGRVARPDFVPNPSRFREVAGRGLVVDVWVNAKGPYTFVIDTGAGATLISERVAGEARVETRPEPIPLAGLSGNDAGTAHQAANFTLALGGSANLLPSSGDALVTANIPAGVDGILDPTQAFWPLGFVLDLPAGLLRPLDPRTEQVRAGEVPAGGAILAWLDDENWRPFVQFGSGRRALIDTGSRFGLAVDEEAARWLGLVVDGREKSVNVSDLGGGRVVARRVRPATVRIGSLELVNVPTDVLLGVAPGAPIILGRDALRPFEIAFDPTTKLIRFAPRVLAER